MSFGHSAALGSMQSLLRPKSPQQPLYEPESLSKVKDMKRQMEDVLDNIQGLVGHVVQREQMKIKQHTNPQLNHARLKIASQENKVRQLQEMDTKEHQELRELGGDLKAYDGMIQQLRAKMQNLDFLKHKERL